MKDLLRQVILTGLVLGAVMTALLGPVILHLTGRN